MNILKFIGGTALCGLSLCSQAYTAADFAPERPDGSTTRSLAWLHGEIARARPAYDSNTVTNRDDLPAWRGKVRAKLTELLQLTFPKDVPFRLVKEERRDGYALRKYEFSVRPVIISGIMATSRRCWACRSMASRRIRYWPRSIS